MGASAPGSLRPAWKSGRRPTNDRRPIAYPLDAIRRTRSIADTKAILEEVTHYVGVQALRAELAMAPRKGTTLARKLLGESPARQLELAVMERRHPTVPPTRVPLPTSEPTPAPRARRPKPEPSQRNRPTDTGTWARARAPHGYERRCRSVVTAPWRAATAVRWFAATTPCLRKPLPT